MLLKQCLSLALVLSVTACSNSITYHHSERNSIALEARATDPQQPLQGIIGVKTRTVVVAPGMKKEKGQANTSNNGESTSVINDFRLDRDPKDTWEFGTTTIQSAFITGEAAIHAPATSVAALSGLGIDGLSKDTAFKREMMTDIYRRLDHRKDDDAIAREHVARLDALASLLPKEYKTGTYYILSNQVLKQRDMAGFQYKNKKFLEAIDYEQVLLSGSITYLNKMASDREVKYKATSLDPAAVITSVQLEQLLLEKKRLEMARLAFFNLIGNHNAIDMAAAYAISSL